MSHPPEDWETSQLHQPWAVLPSDLFVGREYIPVGQQREPPVFDAPENKF
jgi:hypothetical protein